VVVTGHVDGQLRALVRVPLAASSGGPRTEVEAWVDTAFNGGLTLPRSAAAGLGLSPGVSSDAVLADGSRVELESFVCYLDWFGATYRTQAVATDGAYPLLGTQLLAGRRLVIDYAVGTVELT
jgi:predicted aspartyl protease